MVGAAIWLICLGAYGADERTIELRDAVVVAAEGLGPVERAAVQMLVEEVEKRSGVRWAVTHRWVPGDPGTPIAVQYAMGVEDGRSSTWSPTQKPSGNAPPESIQVGTSTTAGGKTTVIVAGGDARGVLFACGRLLRELRMSKGSVRLPADFSVNSSPAYPIRGHQLGFRHRANSWDAWTVAEMEQHIRELTFFGVNSIENIPFQDSDEMTLAKVGRREMNRAMSEICAKYGLDYWVWTPADFDLKDAKLREEMLEKHEELYEDCPELTAVFFPGGDPGDNPPELVMPFLEDIAQRLMKVHPDARVWLSLQGFGRADVALVREYLETKSPDWLGGIVVGPGSPPIPATRQWLPEKYPLRLYPDITHNKLCQYPVPWWDQAYALTLGREAINPRPVQYAYIHNWFAPYSEGFISYSDGVHDDVNKAVWSALSWDPAQDVRDVLVEYARVFFGPDVAEEAADGILALERNWRGPLAANGAVEGTLEYWQRLEKAHPELEGNWRWQMNLLRAYYDAYTRRRFLYETELEREANAELLTDRSDETSGRMYRAKTILNRAAVEPVSPELRERIEDLCAALFQSIDLQTSVEKYQASGAERGAVLDFVDYPLNNRWWLEDEFEKVQAMNDDDEKTARLMQLATWEDPGPGGFYDDIGNAAKSPHVRRSEELFTVPGEEAVPSPTHWWLNNGLSRARLSWQTSMEWPEAVVYQGLDPRGAYTVRTTGYGQGLLRIDGERVTPIVDGRELGEIKEFSVPAGALADRELVLTWDRPTDEGHLNWRQQSRVCEVWLIKGGPVEKR